MSHGSRSHPPRRGFLVSLFAFLWPCVMPGAVEKQSGHAHELKGGFALCDAHKSPSGWRWGGAGAEGDTGAELGVLRRVFGEYVSSLLWS